MKTLYEFTVKYQKEKPKVFLKKPTHSELEDGEYIYGLEFNKLMNDGYLSRAMMNKKFDDIGGVMSEKKASEVAKSIKELVDSQKTIEFFEGASDLSDEQKTELDKAKETFALIQKKLVENDLQLQQMYAQSADAKAEQKMIKWFVLNNSYFYEKVKKDDDYVEEAFPLFEGDSFEEKEEEFNNLLEELDDDDGEVLTKKKTIAKESLVTLRRATEIWYNGIADNQKDIKKALKEYYSYNE